MQSRNFSDTIFAKTIRQNEMDEGTLLYKDKINIISDNFIELFNLIDEFEETQTRKQEKKESPPEFVTPKEFLSAINGHSSIKKDELFNAPKNHTFKTSIEEIYNNNFSTKQKAAEILYTIIKNKSFKYQNKKIAIICFTYFLYKNKIYLQAALHDIKILFLITLLIEKSSASDRNKMLNLIEKMLLTK